VLKKKDSECLYEILKPKSEDAKSKQELWVVSINLQFFFICL
jgi:hypothetical protein